MGEFYFTMLAALAALEAKQTSERTIIGLAAKRARGERTGNVPYGHRLEAPGSQKLIEEPSEQAIIEHARTMRASGQSFAAIADALNRMGRVNRRGNRFRPESIFYMLRDKEVAV